MTEENAVGAGSGRRVRIALAVSVALNLAILGAVGGAMLRDGGPQARMASGLEFGPFTEALSREDRAALRQAFLQKAPDMRDMRRQMRRDFAGLLAVLRAEPFDVAALREVMAAQSARMTDRLALGQGLLLERLEVMTPAARAEFADRLEQRLRRGPEGRGPEGRAAGG